MQQRQPRLGDILDDYCPRERRLTNHAVVAMIGDEVKQTRCTTCESEHEYKHARIPRQRRKPEQSALFSQVLAHVAPKKTATPAVMSPTVDDASEPAPPVVDDAPAFDALDADVESELHADEDLLVAEAGDVETLFDMPAAERSASGDEESRGEDEEPPIEEGPAHRRLIRAQLPRHDGQVTTSRQGPDFTIRQPNNPRSNRFRPRQPRSGGAQFQGNRGGNGGNGHVRGSAPRPSGRPGGQGSRGNHRGPGRNRSK